MKAHKLSVITRIRGFIHRHRLMTIIVIGVVLIASASAVTVAIYMQQPKTVTLHLPPPAKPKPKIYYSPLTGEKVKDEAATTAPVTAVMIENSLDARPQSGLKDAGVVYEAIAEGGITRFMALYQNENPKLIGPVRSVRPYDLDWMRPFDASLAHVGGSAKALRQVRNGTYRDLDQFFNSGYYWRSNDRWAPHNMYTTMTKLHALENAKGYKTSKFTGFDRADEKAAKTVTAGHVTVNFSSYYFNTQYVYNKKTNNYTRYQAGAVHKDRELGAITPKVIIAMRVDERTVMQDGHREDIGTNGSGRATLFQNGTAQNVTWHKKNQKSQIYFTDKSGKRVALVRGQTWIAAVPNGEGSVSWKK